MFIDESGDLGIHPPGSRFFVVASIVTSEPRALEKIVGKARSRYVFEGELKHHNAQQSLIKFVLNQINELDCQIYWNAVDKTLLEKKRNISWQEYVIMISTIIRRANSQRSKFRTNIVMDRFSYKNHSPVDMEKTILENIAVENRKDQYQLTSASSENHKGLQLADFVAGSIFRNMNRDDQLFKIISHKSKRVR